MSQSDQRQTYVIRVEGMIDRDAVNEFGSWVVDRHEGGATLVGQIRDGAELVAVVDRVVAAGGLPTLIRPIG